MFNNHMSRIFLKIFPLICLFLGACSFMPNELKNAEQVMETNPDSALHLLQHTNIKEYKLESNRALYGLLLFQALDKTNKSLQPDSLIDNSIKYYLSQNNKSGLAKCYYYKGRKFLHNTNYEEATSYYLKSLDCSQGLNDDLYFGEIYGDLGDIYYNQHEFKKAREKYIQSQNYFTHVGDTKQLKLRIIDIGNTYRLENNQQEALQYYQKVMVNTSDSILLGTVFQEIGATYYSEKRSDSAKYYLNKSLHYPYFSADDYSRRCNMLAELYVDDKQYDSAFQLVQTSLKYKSSFVEKRDCYRILVKIEYVRNDIMQMGKYMSLYQSYSDSIRKVEAQVKSSVLENLHNTSLEVKGTKRNMNLIVPVLIIGLIISAFFAFTLYKRNKLRKEQLTLFRNELSSKQQFVSNNLSRKIIETKASQVGARKKATAEDRIKLDKELYIKSLYINDWDYFKKEMNHAFNQIVDRLENDYPALSKKEIIWCCLQLLDVPHTDRMLLLDATSDSLYKLKQRLAQKMNLESTKELDLFLRHLTANNN